MSLCVSLFVCETVYVSASSLARIADMREKIERMERRERMGKTTTKTTTFPGVNDSPDSHSLCITIFVMICISFFFLI